MQAADHFVAGSRRSRMEVKIDILRAISEGIGRPAHIMYRSNLSWSNMHELVNEMERRSLIRLVENGGKRNYVLTEKGLRVLQNYNTLRSQLEMIVAAPQIAARSEAPSPSISAV